MTEKEKAAAGMMYDGNYEPVMAQERARCKDVCFRFNSTDPSQRELRAEMLKKLFGKTGEHLLVESPFWCDYGYNIEVGENFYANHGLVILDAAKVTFGDNVFIAPNCGFYCAGHPLVADERNLGLEYALPITVGNDVWIGGNVAVMPGVTIGDGAVIGAGSVVTKDIAPGKLAYGNPCREIRKITEADRGKIPKKKQM